MTIQKFEDIVAWQKSKEMSVLAYSISVDWRDYGFKDQFLRSSVSVMNNIAEGFERKGDKQLRNFLYIAKGSCGEFRSMLHLGREIKVINEKDYTSLLDLSVSVSKLISRFIDSLSK